MPQPKTTLRVTIKQQIFDQLVAEFAPEIGFQPSTALENSDFISTVLSYTLMQRRRNNHG